MFITADISHDGLQRARKHTFRLVASICSGEFIKAAHLLIWPALPLAKTNNQFETTNNWK